MKKIVLAVLAMWVACLGIPAAGMAFEGFDATEERAMAETLQYALEFNTNGRESYWNNPDTGHSGSVVPFNRFVDTGGLTCREYVSTLYFDGEEETSYGTACRKSDGRWMVVLENDGDDYHAEASARQSYTYVYRDPANYYYPWVYYAPGYYPYRIFFSFVFVSHSRYFPRTHFYSGYRYHSPRRVVPNKPPVYWGHHDKHNAPVRKPAPVLQHPDKRDHHPLPVKHYSKYQVEKPRHERGGQDQKADIRKSNPERNIYKQDKQRDVGKDDGKKGIFTSPKEQKNLKREYKDRGKNEMAAKPEDYDSRGGSHRQPSEQSVEQGWDFSRQESRSGGRQDQRPQRNPWQQRR